MFRPLSQTKFINDANLVSYWKLDGNSTDSKGSNNGTDTAITYGTSYGIFDQGALFVPANSSAITMGDVGTVEGIGAITISAWIYPTANNTRGMIVAKDASGQRSFSFEKSFSNADNYMYFQMAGEATGSVTTTSAVTLNAWNFVMVTYDSSFGTANDRIRIYINGVKQGLTITTNGSGNVPTTTSALQIGAREYVGTRQFFAGNIDDVAIFSRALSAGEVAELYQSMTLGEYLPNSNTKLLLHLNGSSADSSGNNNNGTDTAITYSQANGKFGQGAGFNGSSSKITLGSAIGLTNTSDYTISEWFKFSGLPTSGAQYQQFFNFQFPTSSYANAAYYYNGGTLQLQFEQGGGNSAKYNVNLSTNTWYNIVFTKAGTALKIYLNGINVATGTSGIAGGNGSNTGWIFNYQGTGSWFNGCGDEVIVENRVWSAEEIKKYYTMTKGRFGII